MVEDLAVSDRIALGFVTVKVVTRTAQNLGTVHTVVTIDSSGRSAPTVSEK